MVCGDSHPFQDVAVLLEGILAPVAHHNLCMTCLLAPAALPLSAKANECAPSPVD